MFNSSEARRTQTSCHKANYSRGFSTAKFLLKDLVCGDALTLTIIGPVGFTVMWFYVRDQPKGSTGSGSCLKYLRRWGHSLNLIRK